MLSLEHSIEHMNEEIVTSEVSRELAEKIKEMGLINKEFDKQETPYSKISYYSILIVIKI